MRLPAFAAALCIATPALSGDLTVTFRDGAPKDRFTISYDGSCAAAAMQVDIDLGTAPAGLISTSPVRALGWPCFSPSNGSWERRGHLP